MSDQTERAAFAERDTSKPAEQQGLFRKFIVRRTDGSDAPGGKHDGCEYFVLDTKHDAHAPAALAAYAEACRETHPELSADLIARYGLARAAQPAAEPVARVWRDGATVRLDWDSVKAAHNAKPGPLYTHPAPAAEPPGIPVHMDREHGGLAFGHAPAAEPLSDALDAKRYRWLRDHAMGEPESAEFWPAVRLDLGRIEDDRWCQWANENVTLDAAIDALLEAAKVAA